MSDGRRHWLVTTSEENYATTARRRFTLQGFKARHRRAVERMRPGDRLCWYVTRVAVFPATATVISPAFEDATPLWRSEGRPDAYPWRVRLRPAVTVPRTRGVPAARLVPGMRFASRFPAPHWRLALQGQLREIPAADFARVERALARAKEVA